MSDTPALANIAYDDLVVDDRKGPFAERVTSDLAGRLAGPIGQEAAVEHAPPAVFPVLFLRALRRGMGGIPAGSVLAKQQLEFHAPLAVDTEAQITMWVGAKEVRRERPLVTIEFDIRDEEGTQVVTGRKTIVWPTGPGEAVDA